MENIAPVSSNKNIGELRRVIIFVTNRQDQDILSSTCSMPGPLTHDPQLADYLARSVLTNFYSHMMDTLTALLCTFLCLHV